MAPVHPVEVAKCGSSNPKAIRARPLSIAARCADSPMRGLRNIGMPKPVSRPSIKSSAPMKHSVEEMVSIVIVSEITDPWSVSRDLPTLSLFVNRIGREDDQPGPAARRHHRRYCQRGQQTL